MCKCEPLKESYEASGELENKCRTSRCAVRVLCTVHELLRHTGLYSPLCGNLDLEFKRRARDCDGNDDDDG
jgi:hypothetical protein